MRLTSKGEYACLAINYLASKYGLGLVKIDEVSSVNKIPRKFLEQILLILNHAGYVSSKRGSDGGYMLCKDPSLISVAEIVRLIDGPLAPVDSASEFFFDNSPIEESAALLSLFKEIRDVVADKLERTTFGDFQ